MATGIWEMVEWVATNILGQPAILIGIIILIGLLLQKKPFAETIAGTVKGAIGFMLMLIGADIFVAGLGSFNAVVGGAFHITQIGYPGIPLGTFTATYGSYVAIIMFFAFMVHLILVRITPLKNVYLTGHLMWWVSLVTVATIIQVSPDASALQIITIGTIVMALYWTIQPAYIHRFMRRVTGTDEIAYGHTSSSTCFLSAILGRFVGKPEESTGG